LWLLVKPQEDGVEVAILLGVFESVTFLGLVLALYLYQRVFTAPVAED
jgi:hypothetical protein